MPLWADILVQVIVPIVVGLLASSGLWAILAKKMNTKSADHDLLMGLAHDRIMSKGKEYLDRGWLTIDEYSDFKQYLYEPYAEGGGNGTGAHMMALIDKLPIHIHEEEEASK